MIQVQGSFSDILEPQQPLAARCSSMALSINLRSSFADKDILNLGVDGRLPESQL